MDSITRQRQEVTVTDINMPFGSMVRFLIKLTLAAIPAAVVVTIFTAILLFLLRTFVAGLGSGLSR